ncbi:MAG TPA: FAD-binding oxidoreductase [Myxococcota bacterium]|nr:FAD-binding oxidoreductase [Myxococcota bacterium]
MSARRTALSALGVLLAASAALAVAPIVNDVSQLNPIRVERVVSPKSVEEVQALVRSHAGPISIGGARHSMGGQIASEGALFLDMRSLASVVALSTDERWITVQAGVTWRKIQEAIDPHGLAVRSMQSYANFTVGGSLSVNAHGRYVGQGPLIASVRSIRIVLADGSLVEASREANPELFFGAIGGYGGLGVIVEATLDLAENQRIARDVKTMPVGDYHGYFDQEVRGDADAVFHNGDLYPPRYDQVRAITWRTTDRPATVPDHLVPRGGSHWMDRVAMFGVSELPFGKELRAGVLDPLRLRSQPVVWRNYEASYDVSELEPSTRRLTTYVLEEYFIPVARFDAFVPRMAEIFRRNRANVINVSIRHALADPGTLLAWARGEVFAFVVYYKQGTSERAREKVGAWTRELIDAALEQGGSYYLPYQLHATDEQFHRAYPRAGEYFALKRNLDPDYRFRNQLWNRYYPAAHGRATPELERAVAEALRAREDYQRPEDQTYLTLPEWTIVYSADEVAAAAREGRRPSDFPWFASVGRFWDVYGTVRRETRGRYPANWTYRTMIGVIGVSYTAEYVAKGLYENSFGRVSEWIGGTDTDEDRFAAEVAEDYSAFLHHTPWYAYPFTKRLRELWSWERLTNGGGFRGFERRMSLSTELVLKAGWGALLGLTTGEPEASEVVAWTRPFDGQELPEGIRALDSPAEDARLLAIPRYEPFTASVTQLARQGVEFVEISGNREIVMTAIGPADWKLSAVGGRVIGEWPQLLEPGRKRVAIALPVQQLPAVIRDLESEGAQVEHLYDY